MRIVPLISAILFSAGTSFASEIREFSVSTLERLGNELSRRDSMAARAADLVSAQHPEFKKISRGWITELGSPNRVHMIMQKDSNVADGYVVTYPSSGAPLIEDHRGQELSASIAVRYRARETALTALKGKLFNLAYNFEVLNDPDGSGFLVYALGATPRADEVVLAGHFRVTISADGRTAERVDALSRSVLVIKKGERMPAGYKGVGLYMSQLVGTKPVETCIYTNRLHNMPVMVVTPDGTLWTIENGEMKITGSVKNDKDGGLR